MSEKKKFEGHKRNGKSVVPVIFYAPPQVHRAIKAKAKRLDTTQNALLNAMAARNVASKPKKTKPPVTAAEAFAQ